MTILAMNLLLALVWLALTGEITPGNFALGFAAGYGALRVSRGVLPKTGYFGKLTQLARFAGFFLWELVKANLRVAYDVLTPRHHMMPAVVAIPLDLETDEEITLLATLMTLTPGTLVLDVSRDRRTLYIHAMYVHDVEKTRAEIKNGFERRVMELLR